MNYELALKLKKAGFPQKGIGGYFIHTNEVFRNEKNIMEYIIKNDIPYNPTFSEIIEACGEKFVSLNRYPNAGTTQWWASSKNHSTSGSTPEEAVANLWLILNNK